VPGDGCNTGVSKNAGLPDGKAALIYRLLFPLRLAQFLAASVQSQLSLVRERSSKALRKHSTPVVAIGL
jgi:hypothetical protein